MYHFTRMLSSEAVESVCFAIFFEILLFFQLEDVSAEGPDFSAEEPEVSARERLLR